GFNNGAKFYLKDVDVDSDIDSVVIRNNQFVMRGSLADAPKSLWLYTKTSTNFYYTTLMIGNETITINGDIKDFPFDLSISGSKTQDEHTLLLNQEKAGYKERNKLFFLKNKYSRDTLRQMFNSLSPQFKQSDFGQRIANYIKVGPILEVGDKY